MTKKYPSAATAPMISGACMVLLEEQINVFQLHERRKGFHSFCNDFFVASFWTRTIQDVVAFVEARYVHDNPLHFFYK